MAEGIWRGIWLAEAHHSTAIEGDTLVLRQVEALLAEGRAVGDKDLSEYMEVHQMAMTPVWDVAPHSSATSDEAPGSFRRHEIQPFPGGMTPPPWTEVPAAMTDWMREVIALRQRGLTLPAEIGRVHCLFERIHPFLDGNGRTGRLLVNLVLVRLGYPPTIIHTSQRTRYLEALRRGDQGDFGPLGEMLARAILDNLYKFVLPAIAGPARLVPLAALATPDLSASALRVAASRGRLQATKGADGQWRSSGRWVQTTSTRVTDGTVAAPPDGALGAGNATGGPEGPPVYRGCCCGEA